MEMNKLQIILMVKQQYNLKLPDAIIAATSICYDLPLLTCDKEFKKVP